MLIDKRQTMIISTTYTSNPLTGGCRLHHEIVHYLENKGVKLKILNCQHPPLFSYRNYLFCNFWCIYKFISRTSNDREKRIIVLEDTYEHPRQFLFNLFLKILTNSEIVIVFQTIHYHLIKSKLLKKVDSLILRLFLRCGDKVISVSKAGADELKQNFGVNRSKVYVIHPGFDRIDIRQKVKREKKNVNIIFVGTCVPCKGIEYLIKAFSLLNIHNAVLHIIGQTDDDINYFHRLLSLRRALKIEDRIIFHGRKERQELYKFYFDADIFVLPSVFDSFPIVLMEAMQFGLPIIATNAGGIPELIEDGKNGILVPSKDSKAIARAIELLIRNRALRERLGYNGRERAKHLQSWQKARERYYETILA